jgi:hypothetical protein
MLGTALARVLDEADAEPRRVTPVPAGSGVLAMRRGEQSPAVLGVAEPIGTTCHLVRRLAFDEPGRAFAI